MTLSLMLCVSVSGTDHCCCSQPLLQHTLILDLDQLQAIRGNLGHADMQKLLQETEAVLDDDAQVGIAALLSLCLSRYPLSPDTLPAVQPSATAGNALWLG